MLKPDTELGVTSARNPHRDTVSAPYVDKPRSGPTLRSIRIGLVTLNLLIVLLCGLLLERAWRVEVADAQADATTAAQLLERGTSATFDKISIALNGVAAQLERQLAERGVDPASLWALGDFAVAQVPELERIGVFDTTGQQVCGVPLERCRRFNIGDRAYFAALREQPGRPPTLFGPFDARPTNEPSLLMVRALRTPDQAFAGVVVAAIPLARMQPLVAAAQPGGDGVASLRMATMEPLVRASRVNAPSDADQLSISERLRQTLAESPDAGFYRAVSPADGVDRVTAYRRLPKYPVYALVGEATRDFLGAWRGMAALTGGFLVLIAVASLAVERVARSSLIEQERAQRLYDDAPCGYHTLDAAGRYLSINATELRWLGCARADVVGKQSPVDFFTDEGKASFARNFPLLKSSGRLDELPVDLVGRQGEVRRVLVSAKAVVDARGAFLMSNSVMHDISELHHSQELLRETAHLQALMLDTELLGMARVKNRHVVWANRGMDAILGYGASEWQGMPVQKLLADDEAAEPIARHAYPELRAGRTYRTQLPLRRKDGSVCWTDIGVALLAADADEVMLLVTDISAQKAAEAGRQREMELRAQNEQLLEVARLKDEFLSNMSHELRTPLNAVIGFSQLLRMAKADPSKLDQYVSQIADSGQHLLSLVQTMLDFAKATSATMTFAPQPIAVRRALDEVVEMLEPKALTARVAVSVSVDPPLDGVVNDPLRLRQMLLNLVGNAIKFSKPAGVVNLRARGLDADRWCVEVEDHGIGIGPDDLPRLFSRFVQLSSGPTKAYGGLGLGLALVRRIARAQGGDVQVRSELGVGSVFTLVLPRVLRPSSPPADAAGAAG